MQQHLMLFQVATLFETVHQHRVFLFYVEPFNLLPQQGSKLLPTSLWGLLRLQRLAAFDGIDYRQNNVVNVFLLVHIVRARSALHNAAVNGCLDVDALN